MANEFTHYKIHTQYSICEGAIKISDLAKYCSQNKVKAIGISDTQLLSGALEFSDEISKTGTQPIIGTQINLKIGSKDNYFTGAVSLIAANETGYKNLLKLSSKSYLDLKEMDENPFINMEDLGKFSEGLIILLGGNNSLASNLLINNRGDDCYNFIKSIKNIFNNNSYIEIQRHNEKQENFTEQKLIDISQKLDLPLIATQETFYLDKEMYEAHDAYLCIGEKTYVNEKNRKKYSEEHYLKSDDEIKKLYEDLPDAYENNCKLKYKINFFPQKSKPVLPNFDVGNKNIDDVLKDEANKGLAEKFENFIFKSLDENQKKIKIKEYQERLSYEISVITKMKFSGYFLIVSDYIKWAKNNDIPVGPGRGSGAGSLVAWCLSITDLDPIRFGLLFERFLNPDRISLPDFDVDFCQEGRDEVINYVKKKYENKIAQIITFGKLQARMAIRDIGRVIGLPYGRVDQLSKMIPFDPSHPTSLAESIAVEPRLQQAEKEDPTIKKLLNISLKVEGLYRNIATHAAGIIISEKNLDEIIPLYKDLSSELPIPVTQFDMKSCEDAGLVKFDFLGLKTLTVIKKTVNFIKKSNPSFDINKINLDDQETFELLSSGQTMGVFQLESSGMRDVLKNLKPNKFEDIIALVALYRPGPMQNIPTYINRKHGKEDTDYIHEKLKIVLKETYGVIIYQEQVMQIAQILSGFSPAKADILRKAMGKKKSAEMERQKKDFINGAIKNGISSEQAIYIFQLVEKFAQYGFNKSHAAAYALIAYQTAYLKAHFPIYFFCASMNTELGNTDKLNLFYEELKRLKIEIYPPNINYSFSEFLPQKNKIYYALSAIKAVGQSAISGVIDEREKNGKFKSINDFFSRVDHKYLNKLQLEGLIKSGSFDSIESNRRNLFDNVQHFMKVSKSSTEANLNDQEVLFKSDSLSNVVDIKKSSFNKDWTHSEKIKKEFESLGFFVSEHPLKEHKNLLDSYKVVSHNQFHEDLNIKEGMLAGTIVTVQEKKTNRGMPYAIVKFVDLESIFEFFVFSENLLNNRDKLIVGNSFLIGVKKEMNKDGVERSNVVKLLYLNDFLNKKIDTIKFELSSNKELESLSCISKDFGETRVNLNIKSSNNYLKFVLKKKRNVTTESIKSTNLSNIKSSIN